jgi:competence protein ComEC
VISIGGIISAIAALFSPSIGSMMAGLLHYPTDWLIKLVEFVSNLPGNSVVIGSISNWQMLCVYALILLICLVKWWQQRWLFASLIAFGLVLVPAWHSANTLVRVTVLDAGAEPVVVIQDQGNVTLINSGDEGTGRYTIVPFLQQQGVNKIDWAIASDFNNSHSNAWLEILQSLPIKNFYKYDLKPETSLATQEIQQEVKKHQGIYHAVVPGQQVTTGLTVAQLIKEQLPVLYLQIQNQNWLLVGDIEPQEIERLAKIGGLPTPQVLWCSPESLKDLVKLFQPKVAIATSTNLDSKITTELSKSPTQVFFTGRDGAIQWTPNGKFESFIQETENKLSVL